MNAHLSMLDQEFADTLEDARRRRGLPPAKAPAADLARDLVGAVRAPRVGVCQFCGTRAPLRTVCVAHEDLIDCDPSLSAVVTQKTTNGSGHAHSEGAREAGATGGSS